MTREQIPDRRFGRRRYLTSAAAGIGAVLSFAGSATAWNVEDQYRTVVDVVEAGADDSGAESITPVVRERASDDTLLRFPPGRYYVDEQFRLTDFENVGFVGDDATLVPAAYEDFEGPQYRLFRLGTSYAPGRDLRFEGFRVDQTAPNTGIRVLDAVVTDGLVVKDVYIHGVHDSGTWGPGRFDVVDASGHGLVERFRAFDGGCHVDETPNAGNMWRGPTGISVDEHHRGTIVFADCVLGGFPDNGLYVSSETGRTVVDGGWFENSTTGSIRLGGRRGTIRNVTGVVDSNPDRLVRQHPIRLDSGRIDVENVDLRLPRPNGDAIRVMNDVDEASIADSSIAIGPVPSSGIRIDPAAGPTYVEDVDVAIDGSANAIRILGRDAGTVGVQDVRITGDAGGSPMRHAIYCERNGCQFRGLSVDQPGAGKRRGIELRGNDAFLYDSTLETSDVPIVVNGADDVWIEDCTARSYDGDRSIRITADSGTVRLKDDTFPGGVSDAR
ncbi:hypothetical protein ACFOZ7_08775 [Natribaculum luteum]|uniref:Right-handed parallel beta-helix repeat-containing protein n=1 Tax=Natribaculum luteum TaxID=1586232 RepID=A0ABD5NYJ8_9EURY